MEPCIPEGVQDTEISENRAQSGAPQKAQFHGVPFVWFTIVARRMILVKKIQIPIRAVPKQMAIRQAAPIA